MIRRLLALAAALLVVGALWATRSQGDPTLRPEVLPNPVAAKAVLEPASAVWQGAREFRLHLNRTPSLYSSGPRDDGTRPTAVVRLLRQPNGETFVRLQWTDASAQEAKAGVRLPDVGADSIYKQHSRGAGEFADAACVMLPQQRPALSPGPSITMGGKGNAVDLYYWRAGVGFEVLSATGISTVAGTGAVGSGGAVREKDGWSVTFSVGKPPSHTPIAFAIWDGAKQHRDGLKYFSLWCEVG